MDEGVGFQGFVVADGEGEGADGDARVVLLFVTEQGPGERYRTFGIVGPGFVADRTVVA